MEGYELFKNEETTEMQYSNQREKKPNDTMCHIFACFGGLPQPMFGFESWFLIC